LVQMGYLWCRGRGANRGSFASVLDMGTCNAMNTPANSSSEMMPCNLLKELGISEVWGMGKGVPR
jgi:hypothetical protein